jgi:parallel beta-helix repeat protein
LYRIGIAVGPRTWFGDKYDWNENSNGTIRNNRLTGAFGYAMAVGSANGFTIQGNTLFGNTAFIGADGPNCTTGGDAPPAPAGFVFDANNTARMSMQSEFASVPSADGLTCVMPPPNGDFWP